MSDTIANSPLAIALSVAVPLWMLEILSDGGITETDINSARAFEKDISGPGGEALLFRSEVPGETARLFNGLAKSIAVLAFCPGGIRIFGQHFEAATYGKPS